MTDILLVVIDAQRAFVDPEGSLARAYGIGEVRPAMDALARLLRVVGEPGTTISPEGAGRQTVLVRSEYRPGQFTGGQLDHPLADLCVPGRNVDCEWASGLDTTRATIITKHQMDAGETGDYRNVIAQAIEDGCLQIVLAGFQLTTCVRATALTTMRLTEGTGARVIVAEDLVGARASSYARTSVESRVDATWRELRAAGVHAGPILPRLRGQRIGPVSP
jgi:nicotinamidase-related amidase